MDLRQRYESYSNLTYPVLIPLQYFIVSILYPFYVPQRERSERMCMLKFTLQKK